MQFRASGIYRLTKMCGRANEDTWGSMGNERVGGWRIPVWMRRRMEDEWRMGDQFESK